MIWRQGFLAVTAAGCMLAPPSVAQQFDRDDPASPIRVKAIEFVAVGEQEEQRLRKILPIREGDTVRDSDFVRTAKAISAFDRGLTFQVGTELAEGPRDATVRISGVGPGPAVYVQPARLKIRIEPMYPATARQEHLQGTVTLDILIGADGLVHEPRVTSGLAELVDAALAAVKQWVYDPELASGERRPSRRYVSIDFDLKDGTPRPVATTQGIRADPEKKQP
jgi:TonB family protein